MKKIGSIIAVALFGLACFFAGFFVRQPKINKLKAQIKHLQSEIIKLQALRDKQNGTISRLLLDYKSLKVFSFSKRSKMKDNIKAELVLQYGAKEYLQLLLDRANTKRKFSNEEKVFFNAFDGAIEGEKVTDKELNKIKTYILNKYRKEIDKLIPCDYNEQIAEIEKFKVK